MDEGLPPELPASLAYLPEGLRVRDLGGGLTLRHAVPAEYPQVGNVLEAAFSTGCWITEEYRAGLHRIAERAATSHVWIVTGEDGVLGAVLTPQPQFHTGEHFTFAIMGVGPNGRGLGLGRTLTDHAVALARALGYRVVQIRSSPQMTAAHQVYYRYGFVRRIEWETAVVDGGQRLLCFTYTIPDPLPRPPLIPRQPSPPAFSLVPRPKGDPVDLETLRPAGHVDAAGQFHLAAPHRGGRFVIPPDAEELRLVASTLAPQAWPARIALRRGGLSERVAVEEAAAGTTTALYDSRGRLLSDDWRWLAPALAALADDGKPPAKPDELTGVLQADLVEGLYRATFSENAAAREAAGRVFFARLGALEVQLGATEWLAREQLGDADLTVFGVLIGYELGYRSQLGWGAPVVADYPNLWSYARRLLQQPGFVSESELAALGWTAGAGGAVTPPR